MQTQNELTPQLFIGIDVHKKSWSISMRTDIAEHKTYSAAPRADKLFEYVSKNFKDYAVSLVYEAGPCGFSAARYFLNMSWKVLVVNPADIPKTDKQQYQKTDKLDSINLSKQLQKQTLKAIHIPTEQQEQLRSLLRQRIIIVKQLRKAKSHIKSMLLFHGIDIPPQYDNPNWTKDFKKWLKELKWAHTTGADSMASKLRTYDFVYSEYLMIANQLRAYCRKYHREDYYLLTSIPGIGGYLAAAILAEAGDIRRFNNERQFSSYVGVIPGMYDSGEKESKLGVTPRSNRILRSYLVEAAWVAVRKDPEIQAYYRKFTGKNPKMIIVKIAHKMVRRILSVIKTKTPYRINHSLQLDEKLVLPEEALEIISEAEQSDEQQDDE
jgi:transposase